MITGKQRLGTYRHREGKIVDMRTGMIKEDGKFKRVYFYLLRAHPQLVSREALLNDWTHVHGNHVLGKQAGCQPPLIPFQNMHQCTWEEWIEKRR